MERVIRALGLTGRPEERDLTDRLAAYRDMLVSWNRKMDLTSVADGDIPMRHLADSLLPLYQYPDLFPRGASLADVGTGAGLPGLPIAIARGDLRVTLIESMRKRCDFLEAVQEKLGLNNARVLCLRAEEAGQQEGLRESFDRTVSRAVAAAPVLLEYLLPLTRVGGAALCWKGPGAAAEAAQAKAAAETLGCPALSLLPVSFPGEERWLIRADKSSPTPPRYPRRTGIPSKRPLGEKKDGNDPTK